MLKLWRAHETTVARLRSGEDENLTFGGSFCPWNVGQFMDEPVKSLNSSSVGLRIKIRDIKPGKKENPGKHPKLWDPESCILGMQESWNRPALSGLKPSSN